MNIYQLQQDLIAIFDEIEENGGEITPELEKELSIKQEEFKEKVENYTKVIKLLEQDINSIKEEKKRLTDLATSKQKVIDRLTTIIIGAINTFGETKKTGVKYLDYGTGSVSIRNSKSVSINDDVLKSIGCAIRNTIRFSKETNQLDVINKLNADAILANLDGIANDSDILHTNVEVNVKIPVSDIIKENGYAVIRELAKYTDNFDLNTVISKSEIKKELEANGACAPNLAQLVINQSIQIK